MNTITSALASSALRSMVARAAKLLRSDLAIYEKAISEMVSVDLTDGQYGALVSWCFNVGISAAQKSTLIKKLNAGDYESVPKELARWRSLRASVCRIG